MYVSVIVFKCAPTFECYLLFFLWFIFVLPTCHLIFNRYEACMDVTDSDHKPVRCIFTVDIARVDESIRRQELGEILKSNEKIKFMAEEICKIPETIVSTNNVILQNQDTSILRITNKCGNKDAFFEIICEGQSIIKEGGHASDHCPRGSFGFPRWLEVTSNALDNIHTFRYNSFIWGPIPLQ